MGKAKKEFSEKEIERYSRQISVIGEENQRVISEKKVLQVGLGGLGSPLSLYLVSAGVGELVVFEDDDLSLSNLGRQILYSTPDIGKMKTDLAKKRLEELNPNIKITIHNERLAFDNYKRYIDGVDYLVDASDNFETKFLISDIGVLENIPFTIGGIQGWEGQVISTSPRKSACYRCVFRAPPTKKDQRPIPVVSPLCGLVGSFQAMEVLKGLMKQGTRAIDALFVFDGLNNELNVIKLKKNKRCTSCGHLEPV
jgi:molybdopterin/thiamine biosynthesis adenylyltransferase